MTPTKLSDSLAQFVAQNPGNQSIPMPTVPWTQLDLQLCELICDCIRRDGVSDVAAGALTGVPSKMLLKWKAENEFFATALKTARTQFERQLMREIGEARKRDGTPDWRARAWLLQHTSSKGIVNPAQKAKIAAEEEAADAQNCAILPETPKKPVAPPANSACENAANLPESPKTSATPVNAAPENTTILPETPANAGRSAVAKPGSAAPAAQNTTKLPETPKAHAGTQVAYRKAA